MDPNLTEALNVLFQSVLIALATGLGIAVRWAIKTYGPRLETFLNGAIDEKYYGVLKALADTVVRDLRQNPAYSHFTNEELIKAAVLKFGSFVEELGYDCDEEKLRLFLEEAVQRMKAELGEGKASE